jgi:hypothetical protein
VPVNCTRLKPETLLRRLASDKNVKDSVRLRAIELLILLEKHIPLAQPIKPPKQIEKGELANLTELQAIDSKPFDPTDLIFPIESPKVELLSAAR